MSARETIVICHLCQHENEPSQRFCDECGAELQQHEADSSTSAESSAQSPLASKTTLDDGNGETIVVESLLSLGRVNRYACQSGEQAALLLEETATAPGFLQERMATLADLGEVPGLWTPTKTFVSGERTYAFGPVPASENLEQQVRGSGAFNSTKLRALAEVLAELLREVHQRSFLVRSFQPDRIWWDGEKVLVVDSFERLATFSKAGDDFQVVNGFSAPEAYGVGERPVGIASDLYSAGAVLHFAGTGQRTDLESRENFFSFDPISDLEDPVLAEAILRLTSKAPEDRLQSSDEFVDFLKLEAPPERVPNQVSSTPKPPAQPKPRQAKSVPGQGCSYRVALKSHIGCVRSVNQDACLQLQFTSIEKSEIIESHLVAVVDGMGGEAEGDKAASLALRTIANQVIETRLCLRDQRVTTPLMPNSPAERNRLLLERALKRANRTIFEYAERDISRRGMGCTMTACLLEPHEISIGHIGDTRAYLMRNGVLEKLTTDHSLVGRLVEMGQLTEEEARNSSQRSIIYRAMGTNPEVDVDLVTRELEPGDRLMLASDGVWEYFEHQELTDLFNQDFEPEVLAEQLVSICLARGADDNATLAVIFAEDRED